MPSLHDSEPNVPRWLRIGFWVCIVISVAVVIRRLVALAVPSHSSSSQMVGVIG